jgi:hypothetical protein
MSTVRGIQWPAGTTRLVAIALTGIVAACGSHDNGTAPRQPVVSDAQIESDVATVSAGEIASVVADFSSADTGGSPMAFTIRPAIAATPRLGMRTTCTANAADFQLVYTGTDTLNIDLTWYYFGPDGCQSTFSSSTTDSITYASIDSLHINGSGWTTHSIRDRAYSVSGTGGASLTSDTTHVWNGVGQGTDTSTYTGAPAARTYTGTVADTATAITYPHPRAGAIYPDTGTVSLWTNWTLAVTSVSTPTVTVARHVVATLNGTNAVPVLVYNATSGALALTCTLDLAAHRIVTGSCH